MIMKQPVSGLRKLLVVTTVCIYGIIPDLSHAETSLFWSVNSDQRSCERGTSVIALPKQQGVYGNSSPSHKATQFVTNMGRNLSRAISTRGFDTRGFALEFVAVADSRSFTKLQWESPGGPSPVFATSLVLISASYAVDLFDRTNAWTQPERARVIKWGNTLDKNQREKYQYSSLDSLAAIGAAKLAWGAATGQKKAMRQGQKEFDKLSRRMKNAPIYEANIRDNNEIVATLLIAAEAAAASGINLYGKKYGSWTMHDVVNHHAKRVLAFGPKPIATGEDIARVFFKEQGYTTHLAWMPVYYQRFPNTPAGNSIKQLNRQLRKLHSGKMHGINVGGPTECLWGRVR